VVRRQITARQTRGILANAFFANVLDPMQVYKDDRNLGGLEWRQLILYCNSSKAVGIESMRCHLLYFEEASTRMRNTEASTDDDERQIVFERVRYKPRIILTGNSSTITVAQDKDKQNNGRPLQPVGTGIVVHQRSVELPSRPCSGFVNFANQNFGYGKFIRSCTQEEILESCCPEFTVGLLWIGMLQDDEIVTVRNVRRFATYSGYLSGFRCEGPVGTVDGDQRNHAVAIQDILTMDACYSHHFSLSNIERDVNKAYFALLAHAFLSSPSSARNKSGKCRVISTGKWGCGAFGGTAAHKFVQQALAANLAGVNLDFSAFGSTESCDVVLEALKHHQPAANQVAQALCSCTNRTTFVRDFVSLSCPYYCAHVALRSRAKAFNPQG